MDVVLPNNFTPRKYQARAMRYFDAGGKRGVYAWHRRAGKDLTFLHQTAKMAHKRIAPYWHFFPTFEQGRRAIWEGVTKDGERILEAAFPGFLNPKRPGSIVKRTNEQQMFVEFKCGSLWRLMGSDKVESVGAGPAGVVFSEFSLCRPTSWDYVRPMLRENDGWAAFILTPRGRNHAFKLYQDAQPGSGWDRDTRTIFDTGLTFASNRRPGTQIGPQELIEEERSEGMLEALIRQEYLCDWSAALVGSVYGDLIEALEKSGSICDFGHPNDNIFTTWDLGITDSAAVWWWRIRDDKSGVDLLDYYENHGKPLSHYFDEVDRRKYGVLTHWLPHDARARTFITGATVEEQCIGHWGQTRVKIVPSVSVLDGIQAFRRVLQNSPRIHTQCGVGIECLRNYAYKYDDAKKSYSAEPVHDWASHGADAARMLGVVCDVTRMFIPKPPEPKDKQFAQPTDNTMRLDELFEAHDL